MKCFLLGLTLLVFVFSLASPVKGDVYGSLELRTEYYSQEKTGRGDYKDWGILGRFDVKFEEGSERYKIYFNPVLRADNLEFAEGTFSEYGNEDRHESYVTIREGYLAIKPWGWLELGAGSRIFWWGVGEEINPTNFNPRRYLNLVEPEELGTPSVWMGIDMPKGVYLKLVGSKLTTSQFPWGENSRWRPPELDGVIIEGADVPDKARFAGIFGWSGSGGEFSVTYSRGHKDVPGFKLTPAGGLEPEYFRTESAGMNLSVDIIGLFGVKAEAAYNKQEGGRDEYVQWLLGVDKYLSWERQSLYVILQYVREDVTKEGSNPFQDLDLSRSLKDAATAKIEYCYGDWTFELRGAYDIEKEGYYVSQYPTSIGSQVHIKRNLRGNDEK
jgi:hypothetical protein